MGVAGGGGGAWREKALSGSLPLNIVLAWLLDAAASWKKLAVKKEWTFFLFLFWRSHGRSGVEEAQEEKFA